MTRPDPAHALLGPTQGWTLSHALRRQAARHGDRHFISYAGRDRAGDCAFSFSRPDSLLGRLVEFIQYPPGFALGPLDPPAAGSAR